jgi:hypothetical protein
VKITRDKATCLSCITRYERKFLYAKYAEIFAFTRPVCGVGVKNSCRVFYVCKLGKFELSVFFQVLNPNKPT